MRVDEAVDIVMKTLQLRGYEVSKAEEEGEKTLVVKLGAKTAKVRFHEEMGEVIELHLRYENVPGITILKCERHDAYMRCIEDLLSRF
ncbi:MAG: hypothetical protein LM590_00980 [Thermofilum sp.]|jgi:hypothetical protein|nr:hypothetical protein [Thermofilum sp.]